MTGLAGEIGHIQVDPLGAICSCGNRGCLNTIVAENRLVQLLSVTHGNMTMDDLVAQANNGDPGCRRIIADTAVRIGQVAADLCISIDPEVVVVGGKLAMAGEVFTQPFNEALQRLLFPDAVMPITVLSSSPERQLRAGRRARRHRTCDSQQHRSIDETPMRKGSRKEG